ncbi:hypothetical protein [uncultured Tateyamaria sp.]|uniref:hypothetical protein n=1 Tax=uncultured Tateyamaria sp. TaxID=455651 RepID=UPI0026388918|nr:hypothetical protein [uncultured Tateyamaria sp.]
MDNSMPNPLRKRLHWTALPIAALFWLAYLAYRAPGWIHNPYWMDTLHPAAAGFLSLMAGYAAGMVVTLGYDARTRLFGAMFPMHWRRALIAAGLMAFTPVFFWGEIPFFPALALVFFAGIQPDMFLVLILPVAAALLAAWYAILSILSAHVWMSHRQHFQYMMLIFAGSAAAVFMWLREGYF